MTELVPKAPWREAAGGLYPLGAYLVALPAVDLAARAYPVAIHQVQWRFGLLGLAFTNIGTLLLGLLLIELAAVVRRNRWLLVVLAWLDGLGAAALLLGLGLYGLDTLQLRKAAGPAVKGLVVKAAITASIAGALAVLAMLGLGIGAWRVVRTARVTAKVKGVEPGELLYTNLSGGVTK